MNAEELMFCETCGQEIPVYFKAVDKREEGETAPRWLCIDCHNKMEAEAEGLASVPGQFPNLSLEDSEGKAHSFQIVTRLEEGSISLEAYEDGGDPGFEFVVLGGMDNVEGLYQKLRGKIQRALSYKHLQQGEDGEVMISDDAVVRGTLGWNDDEDSSPLVVIDGKTFSWDELGQMLGQYEGWQFKLEIFDISEER